MCNKIIKLIGMFFALALLSACGGGGGGGGNGGGNGGGQVDPVVLDFVQALFPDKGADWNDYVDGDERLTAMNDNSCNAAGPSCLHGGERRLVEATGKASCAGLTANDDLGAFKWACDDSTGTANLVSTGLADGMYLSDLLDFNTPGFLPNAVTVFENGVAWGKTPSDIWWNNLVVVNNAGGSLNMASAIYLATNNPPAVYSFGNNNVALVIEPGVTVGPGLLGDVITASAHDYLWIEGSVEASAGSRGVVMGTVRFSVLRNLVSDKASTGVLISASTKNRLSDIAASNNVIAGVTLFNGSNNNRLSGITVTNNSGVGVNLIDASNNTLLEVKASNNSADGVRLDDSSGNLLVGMTASNNNAGVTISGGSDNTLSNITAANNSSFGVQLGSSPNNLLLGVTATNGNIGLALTNASNTTISNLTVANNVAEGVRLITSSNNTFNGQLNVGNNGTNCDVDLISVNPGLDSNCVSAATPSTNITLADSFVGKVSDDLANSSDTLGAAGFPVDPNLFDWTIFENTHRAWGKEGSDFPNVDHAGAWVTGTGHIWDWSVSTLDTGANASPTCVLQPCPALLDVLALPDNGGNTITHTFSGPSLITFLRNAVEISYDGIGNNNGLCESDETCLYMPNIGSYQGHGDLVNAGAFTDGTLTGITLMEYESNGR